MTATDIDIDILVIGARLSGIGTAYHLQTKHPQKSHVIFEVSADLGGTWDLFKYPGIRHPATVSGDGRRSVDQGLQRRDGP